MRIPATAGDVVLDPGFAGRIAGLTVEGGALVLQRGLTVDGDATVSGGVLTTAPDAEFVAETLTIDAPAKVVMAAGSKLTLTGAGRPCKARGCWTPPATRRTASNSPTRQRAILARLHRQLRLGPLAESSLERVDSLTLEPGENKAWSAVIDSAAGFAYFGMDTIPGIVVKVRLSDFTRVGALTLNQGEVSCRRGRDRPGGRVCLLWHGYRARQSGQGAPVRLHPGRCADPRSRQRTMSIQP